MSAHTPGPWAAHNGAIYAKGIDFDSKLHGGKTCKECGHDESECYDAPVIVAVSKGLIKDIKKGHWDNFDKSEETSKADMRLMAAAPELVEALRVAYADIQRIPGHTIDMLGRIEAAIAKATGGAL